jgi:hypothetical protein
MLNNQILIISGIMGGNSSNAANSFFGQAIKQ